MGNDLISRSALLEVIQKDKEFIQKGLSKDAEFAYMSADSVIEKIKSIPTAYDVDKVVEQLEELREEILLDTAYDNDTVNHYLGYADLMIEVVKSGGIE